MAAPLKLLLGTRNPGKIQEIQAILGEAVELITVEARPFSDVEEDGETFEENALKKARAIAEETGMAVLAEDSGLVVEALKGAPGTLSARYAGEGASDAENLAKLLEEMKNESNRRARFHCVCVVRTPEGQEWITHGQLDGSITAKPRGRGGFGYDPVFIPDGFSKTLAELPAGLKNRLSHRAKALRAMRARLSAA